MDIDLKSLSGQELRELVTRCLRELDGRRTEDREGYPLELIHEYASGIGNALDTLDRWEGRAWICNLVLDRWWMPEQRRIEWLVDYLDGFDFEGGWGDVIDWWKGRDPYGYDREDLDILEGVFLASLREKGRQARVSRKAVAGA